MSIAHLHAMNEAMVLAAAPRRVECVSLRSARMDALVSAVSGMREAVRANGAESEWVDAWNSWVFAKRWSLVGWGDCPGVHAGNAQGFMAEPLRKAWEEFSCGGTDPGKKALAEIGKVIKTEAVRLYDLLSASRQRAVGVGNAPAHGLVVLVACHGKAKEFWEKQVAGWIPSHLSAMVVCGDLGDCVSEEDGGNRALVPSMIVVPGSLSTWMDRLSLVFSNQLHLVSSARIVNFRWETTPESRDLEWVCLPDGFPSVRIPDGAEYGWTLCGASDGDATLMSFKAVNKVVVLDFPPALQGGAQLADPDKERHEADQKMVQMEMEKQRKESVRMAEKVEKHARVAWASSTIEVVHGAGRQMVNSGMAQGYVLLVKKQDELCLCEWPAMDKAELDGLASSGQLVLLGLSLGGWWPQCWREKMAAAYAGEAGRLVQEWKQRLVRRRDQVDFRRALPPDSHHRLSAWSEMPQNERSTLGPDQDGLFSVLLKALGYEDTDVELRIDATKALRKAGIRAGWACADALEDLLVKDLEQYSQCWLRRCGVYGGEAQPSDIPGRHSIFRVTSIGTPMRISQNQEQKVE